MACLFVSFTTYFANTQKQAQIKSQEIISHLKQHFITKCRLIYVTNGIQDLVKMLYRKFATHLRGSIVARVVCLRLGPIWYGPSFPVA